MAPVGSATASVPKGTQGCSWGAIREGGLLLLASGACQAHGEDIGLEQLPPHPGRAGPALHLLASSVSMDTTEVALGREGAALGVSSASGPGAPAGVWGNLQCRLLQEAPVWPTPATTCGGNSASLCLGTWGCGMLWRGECGGQGHCPTSCSAQDRGTHSGLRLPPARRQEQGPGGPAWAGPSPLPC